MLRIIITCVFTTVFYFNCHAQITPPGMGKANTASWFAIGVQQDLNNERTIHSETYFGLGRISNPDTYNLVQKQSLYVLNEEVSHHFKKNWQYSVAVSYRSQSKYQSTSPYELDVPKYRQEVRLYTRFDYINTFKKINYSISYRPELRFFYNPNFSSSTENTQFRSRFRGKTTVNINSLKTHKIIATAEALFSTSRTNDWSKFEYKEARFCLYYSVILPVQKVTLNLGYMHNIIGKFSSSPVHYLAFDIVVKNPFKR
ncbi:DUF2490 domain-containing protein [Flavobacterium sp. 7A]|uniref:DUF2490 domain-containing protein n=1 Tax=Flavobacterium sp. 7A TaxID=2940571 RepID=UPI0022261876|nr:DUF2490 domain-containing protein [Flavobacterium sp. 7A]MCW2119299.1 hypothetical protein [Flavobacterium sp. 7A]